MWSDASGAWGCGAIWEGQWFQVQWTGFWSDWPGFADSLIAAKELLPIITATAVWGPQWRAAAVVCHCDNMAAVAAVWGLLQGPNISTPAAVSLLSGGIV